MATTTNTVTPAHYLVAFAKLQVHKSVPHITLAHDTIYFGGITTTEDEAHEQARSIVNSAPAKVSSYVMPRVFPMPSPDLLSALYDAQEAFELIIKRMNEAAEAVP